MSDIAEEIRGIWEHLKTKIIANSNTDSETDEKETP